MRDLTQGSINGHLLGMAMFIGVWSAIGAAANDRGSRCITSGCYRSPR